jgi:hypothetical protein
MFPIIAIEEEAPEGLEQLGAREKYWLRIRGQPYLFKVGRQGTGENWAEKVAAELAGLLGVPHACYDLATWKGKYGVLSPSIVPENGRLIPGNELLALIHSGYPGREVRRVREHTLTRIHALLSQSTIATPPNWEPPSRSVSNAWDLFLGYLLLDAWIANQDRHHENWGLVHHMGQLYLAPSYDHAASLGQNETDEKRLIRLTTRDMRQHISAYVSKARSAIYDSKTGDRQTAADRRVIRESGY